MADGQGPELTGAEAKAIRSLKRLAKQWPQSLKLLSAAGSLIVIHSGSGQFEVDERLDPGAVLATIDGIPNDGGDPW